MDLVEVATGRSKRAAKERRWPQYTAAFIATLSSMSVGLVGGWTSNALPLLRDAGLDNTQCSWVGSLSAAGALLGALPAGSLSNITGRKGLLLLLAIPLLLGWILIIIAVISNFSELYLWLLYVGRFVTGMAIGGASVVAPLYNEEICHVAIRGEVGVYQNLMIDVGILGIYIAGAYTSLFWQTLIPSIIPVLFCVVFFLMPESPLFLMAKGKDTKAKKAQKWLCGKEEMTASVKLVEEPEQVQRSTVGRFRNSSSDVKALIIVVGLMAFRQLFGINAFVYYTVDIFQQSGSSLQPSTATIIVGAVQVVATIASSLLVEHVGRRALLLASGIFSTLSHAALSVNFAIPEEALGWLPITAIAVFISAYSIGFGSLPWFIMAEILPEKSRGWMSGVSVAINWFLLFLVTRSFGSMIDHIGQVGTFGLFSVNCLLGTLFVAILLPETSGKSREEIQQMLKGKRKTDRGSNFPLTENVLHQTPYF